MNNRIGRVSHDGHGKNIKLRGLGRKEEHYARLIYIQLENDVKKAG
jgi:hypothetical protein